MGHKGQQELLGDETGQALQRVALNQVQQLAQQQTADSIKVLIELRDNPNVAPNVRRMAANDLLAWGWHKDTSEWGGAAGAGPNQGKPGLQVNLVIFDAYGGRQVQPVSGEGPIVDVRAEAARVLAGRGGDGEQETPGSVPDGAHAGRLAARESGRGGDRAHDRRYAADPGGACGEPAPGRLADGEFEAHGAGSVPRVRDDPE